MKTFFRSKTPAWSFCSVGSAACVDLQAGILSRYGVAQEDETPDREPALVPADGADDQGRGGDTGGSCAGSSTTCGGATRPLPAPASAADARSSGEPARSPSPCNSCDTAPDDGESSGHQDKPRFGVPPKELELPFTDADVLAWILAPHTVDDFFADVWEQKPLHIEHMHAGYFREVMTMEDLEDVLLNSEEDEEFGETLTFKHQQQVYYDNAFRGYLDGASVIVNHMDKEWPPANALCQALGSHLPHAFANMYLTPPHAQAVHPHSDDRDVLLLQVRL